MLNDTEKSIYLHELDEVENCMDQEYYESVTISPTNYIYPDGSETDNAITFSINPRSINIWDVEMIIEDCFEDFEEHLSDVIHLQITVDYFASISSVDLDDNIFLAKLMDKNIKYDDGCIIIPIVAFSGMFGKKLNINNSYDSLKIILAFNDKFKNYNFKIRYKCNKSYGNTPDKIGQNGHPINIPCITFNNSGRIATNGTIMDPGISRNCLLCAIKISSDVDFFINQIKLEYTDGKSRIYSSLLCEIKKLHYNYNNYYVISLLDHDKYKNDIDKVLRFGLPIKNCNKNDTVSKIHIDGLPEIIYVGLLNIERNYAVNCNGMMGLRFCN